MNKSDLVNMIAEQAKLQHKTAEEVVNLIFDSMSNALVTGGRIEIRGFGSFVVREYESYKGRNPRTGESIQVKPKKLPFFKVGKELKELVDDWNHPKTKKPGSSESDSNGGDTGSGSSA
ncbi:MAG: integration host factor subunit beta [Deltaproteobacteria bacterium]|nr:MAG: integration host factor subunit beta [Deltaproteobacteria bacterium]